MGAAIHTPQQHMMKALAIGVALCLATCHASCGDDECEPNAKVAYHNGVHPGRFAGKVCFITGATSGLGEHAAYHLAMEGCAVVVTGRREANGAKVVEHILGLDGISTLSPPAMFIKVDVTSYESVAAATAKIEETYGRLDAVFANAGVANVAGLEQEDTAGFSKVLDVNVVGVFHTIKASTSLLKASGSGSVVICSSIYGTRATPSVAAYITSKHAVEGLKKAAAADLSGYGIRVNNLNPSFTPSEMTGGFLTGIGRQQIVNVVQTDSKMSDLAETSSVTAFLLSSDAQYVSGQSIKVDYSMTNNLMKPSTWNVAVGNLFASYAAAAEEEAPKAEL